MIGISRRDFVATSFAVPLAGAKQGIGLGIGTYGMQSLSTETALRTIAKTGYDGVELALMPGWPTEARRLSREDRRSIRNMLGDLHLGLPAMLEVLPLTGKSAENLERLKQGAQLAHDLAPANPPVIETILGFKSSDWERVKGIMANELRLWAKVAEATDTVFCFKPHAGQAVNSPERTLWLLREVGSPKLRIVYDYSHFSIEGFTLGESLRVLLPYTAFVSVKDSVGTPAKHEYLLPGDGKTDYLEYFRLLNRLAYRGYVIVEVSAMIHRKPGYEPISTARLCYERLAPAFRKAGVRRLSRKG